MAKIPQPHDIAVELLEILVEQHRPGDGLKGIALLKRFGLTRPRADFDAGLNHAIQQKWVEMTQDEFVKLTTAGFSEGGGVLPTPEELAHDVLTALLNSGARPGDGGQRVEPLRRTFGLDRPGSDYEAGLTYALDQKWIVIDNNAFVTFTQVGFEKA